MAADNLSDEDQLFVSSLYFTLSVIERRVDFNIYGDTPLKTRRKELGSISVGNNFSYQLYIELQKNEV